MALDVENPQWRRVVRRYATPLAVAGVVLVLLGAAWSAQAYLSMERIESVSFEHHGNEDAKFVYRVPVVVDSPAFANGSVLGMEQPGYFSTVSPRFELTFSWNYVPAGDESVSAFIDLKAVVAAASEEGETYWAVDRPLASVTQAVVPKEGIHIDTVVDLASLHDEVEDVTTRIGSRPGNLVWKVVATVTRAAAGDGDGVVVEAYELPISFKPPLYSMPGGEALQFHERHGVTHESVTTHQRGVDALTARPVLPATVALGLGLLVALGVARRGDPGRVPGLDGEFNRAREKHADWVTTVPGPMRGGDGRPVVEVGGLKELVGVAAEVRAPVLLDESNRTFHVLAAGVWYRCARYRSKPERGLGRLAASRATRQRRRLQPPAA